jgi:histone deacetylase complex regulatory component SIN3
MQNVAPMLAGNGALLAQFNAFLPEGFRIDSLPRALSGYIRCHDDPSGVTSNNAEQLASTFVDRVLERFEGRPDVLNTIYAVLSTTTLEDPSVQLVEPDEPSSGAIKASHPALQHTQYSCT